MQTFLVTQYLLETVVWDYSRKPRNASRWTQAQVCFLEGCYWSASSVVSFSCIFIQQTFAESPVCAVASRETTFGFPLFCAASLYMCPSERSGSLSSESSPGEAAIQFPRDPVSLSALFSFSPAAPCLRKAVPHQEWQPLQVPPLPQGQELGDRCGPHRYPPP